LRVPSFERFRQISAAGALFVCGMVVGAAAFNGINHEAYNQVILENYDLKQQLDTYRDEMERIRSDRTQSSVIQTITVSIEKPPDKPGVDVVTERELRKRLKGDLAGFLGRQIYRIRPDAALAKTLLEGKIYSGIGGNDYAVRVTTMMAVDGVLQVWVQARIHLRP
jgi:energy-converting hydrogenase Eha subunit B